MTVLIPQLFSNTPYPVGEHYSLQLGAGIGGLNNFLKLLPIGPGKFIIAWLEHVDYGFGSSHHDHLKFQVLRVNPDRSLVYGTMLDVVNPAPGTGDEGTFDGFYSFSVLGDERVIYGYRPPGFEFRDVGQTFFVGIVKAVGDAMVSEVPRTPMSSLTGTCAVIALTPNRALFMNQPTVVNSAPRIWDINTTPGAFAIGSGAHNITNLFLESFHHVRIADNYVAWLMSEGVYTEPTNSWTYTYVLRVVHWDDATSTIQAGPKIIKPTWGTLLMHPTGFLAMADAAGLSTSAAEVTDYDVDLPSLTLNQRALSQVAKPSFSPGTLGLILTNSPRNDKWCIHPSGAMAYYLAGLESVSGGVAMRTMIRTENGWNRWPIPALFGSPGYGGAAGPTLNTSDARELEIVDIGPEAMVVVPGLLPSPGVIGGFGLFALVPAAGAEQWFEGRVGA